MKIVRTVTGDIRPDELGTTYCHEHLLWRLPSFVQPDLDLGLESADAAVDELNLFKAAGGNSVVEMTTHDLHRSPDRMRSVSLRSGINVIGATGFNKSKFSEPFVENTPVEEIAEMMVNDINHGMGGTEVRAGVIKASTSLNKASEGELKIMQAAAIAHRETGAPISTHTEAGTFALLQIEILTGAGVSPGKILIGHLDRKLDWDYHLEIAQSGVYMGFDQIGKEKYAADDTRIRFIRDLIEAGHGKQILLGGDQARKSNWPSYGTNYGPGLAYILRDFVPQMLRRGIMRKDVYDMVIGSPKNFLSFDVIDVSLGTGPISGEKPFSFR
jgi:phosphotriesterase-related protein